MKKVERKQIIVTEVCAAAVQVFFHSLVTFMTLGYDILGDVDQCPTLYTKYILDNLPHNSILLNEFFQLSEILLRINKG